MNDTKDPKTNTGSEPLWRILRFFKKFHKGIRRRLTYHRLLYKKLVPVGIILICLIVLGLVIYLVITPAGPNDKLSDWRLVLDLCTLAMLAFAIRQVVVMKTTSTMDISHKILEADKEERAKKPEMITAALALKKSYVETAESFSSLLMKQENGQKNDLYEYSYHYEYIGQLVYRNQLDFDLVFDTITFPDEVFLPFFCNIKLLKACEEKILQDENGTPLLYPNDETSLFDWIKKDKHIEVPSHLNDNTNTLIELIRLKEKPDTWLGLEYLYRTYELKRAFNARINERSENKLLLTSAEQKEDAGLSAASPRDFHDIKTAWKEIYDQMPL